MRKVVARTISDKATEFQGGWSTRSNVAEVTEGAFLGLSQFTRSELPQQD